MTGKYKAIRIERMSVSLWRKMKAEAVRRGLSIQLAISEAIIMWLKGGNDGARS